MGSLETLHDRDVRDDERAEVHVCSDLPDVDVGLNLRSGNEDYAQVLAHTKTRELGAHRLELVGLKPQERLAYT